MHRGKPTRLVDRRDKSQRRHRPDARYPHPPATYLVLASERPQLFVGGFHLLDHHRLSVIAFFDGVASTLFDGSGPIPGHAQGVQEVASGISMGSCSRSGPYGRDQR
ncbi:MAG TPA: hypothetical protein VHN14_05800 [Kofleriaceae bacterium]|nr:hypothetical protein [Kofleriaceae bacterium]